jgi:hypothetical protein
MMTQQSVGSRGRARAIWLVAVAVAGVVAWALAQQLAVPMPWKALLAALAAGIPLLIAELRERFKQDDDLTRTCLAELRRFTRRRGVPTVSAIRDLRDLNVTPARDTRGGAISPYVRRDADDDLDRFLDEDAFVVLVGESKAGKTRMAAEAIKRKFPDRRLIYPSGAQSLAKLLAAGLNLDNSVVWLDELQTYLGDAGLGRLLDYVTGPDAAQSVTLLGTISDIAYGDYLPQGELDSPYWPTLRGGRPTLR